MRSRPASAVSSVSGECTASLTAAMMLRACCRKRAPSAVSDTPDELPREEGDAELGLELLDGRVTADCDTLSSIAAWRHWPGIGGGDEIADLFHAKVPLSGFSISGCKFSDFTIAARAARLSPKPATRPAEHGEAGVTAHQLRHGRGFGLYRMGDDAGLMPLIDVANVACGFHASDFNHMRTTVRLAKQHGVKVGAHPSLPDLQGFGRREMKIGARGARQLHHLPGRRAQGLPRGRGHGAQPHQAARLALRHGGAAWRRSRMPSATPPTSSRCR